MADDLPRVVGRCEACRWWEYVPFGDVAICRRFSTLDGRAPDGAKLYPAGNLANVVTYFDFGCIQFEAKPDG